MLYFSYGSNLDENDLHRWCKKKKYPIINFISMKPVQLSGYRFRTNYFSMTRKAGAANIIPDISSIVYGKLYEINDEDMDKIREKEGYKVRDKNNSTYIEIEVNVEELNTGIKHDKVKTYTVNKDRLKKTDIRPTDEYIDLITKNARILGFPERYINYIESFKDI